MKQTVEKNNKGKIWFFENINKIEKPLARMIKGKKTMPIWFGGSFST